jgi:hypothetical protein
MRPALAAYPVAASRPELLTSHPDEPSHGAVSWPRDGETAAGYVARWGHFLRADAVSYISQSPHVPYALPQRSPRGDPLSGVPAMLVVAVVWPLGSARSPVRHHASGSAVSRSASLLTGCWNRSPAVNSRVYLQTVASLNGSAVRPHLQNAITIWTSGLPFSSVSSRTFTRITTLGFFARAFAHSRSMISHFSTSVSIRCMTLLGARVARQIERAPRARVVGLDLNLRVHRFRDLRQCCLTKTVASARWTRRSREAPRSSSGIIFGAGLRW